MRTFVSAALIAAVVVSFTSVLLAGESRQATDKAQKAAGKPATVVESTKPAKASAHVHEVKAVTAVKEVKPAEAQSTAKVKAHSTAKLKKTHTSKTNKAAENQGK